MSIARRAFLPAVIGPGLFSHERSIAVRVGEEAISLLGDVTATDERHGVQVHVLERRDDELWVELPAPPMACPQRLRVPAALVQWV